MVEITRDNIREICDKLNDMEFTENEDKEVCEWFMDKIYRFSDDGITFEEEGYDYHEVQFEYFGCFHEERNITDIVDVYMEVNKILIHYSTIWYDGQSLTHTIRIPLDWIFDNENFMKLWKTEMIKNHITNINKEIDEHQRKIEELKKELILEKNKITIVS